MLALEAAGLVKTFRVKRKPEGLAGSFRSPVRPEREEKTAVAGVDLKVEAGETLAFLGTNGAGKSTTIKMLTGILIGLDVVVKRRIRELIAERNREEGTTAHG